MPSSIVNTSGRQPLQSELQTIGTSSASSSTVTLQRNGSIGRDRSTPQPLAAQQTVQEVANVSNPTANFSKPVTSPHSKRRQSNSHSRSNSIGGLRDGVGTLNRWSESTTSSKGSTSHGRSNSFSRRMSFGGPAAFTLGAPHTQSTNKLQKSRPPAAEGLLHHPPTVQQSEAPPKPALSLPPIITLPTLQQSVNDQSSSLTGATTTPSTAGLLSAAVRQAVPDYFDKTWDNSIPQVSPNQALPQGRSPIDPFQPSATLAGKSFASSSPAGLQGEDGENNLSRRHSRNRSQAGKDSSGTTSSDKSRGSKQPSQKTMLSKALQKANTAVLLDSAQNFEGAAQAYSEACNLLKQVMGRTSGDEDRKKLEAIRNTYTKRIKELEKITPSLRDDDGKALPARPLSNDYRDHDPASPGEDNDHAIIETATVARIVNDESYAPDPQSRPIPTSHLPQRRESLLHAAFEPAPYKSSRILADQYFPPRSFSKSPMRERITETSVSLAPPMDRECIPPPLSPRRPPSPTSQSSTHPSSEKQKSEAVNRTSHLNSSPAKDHRRAASTESMSWLDTIDESAGSTNSSVRSRTSSFGARGGHVRGGSGATEAEFDAALDAAVEAAYDEGFEPADDPAPVTKILDNDDEIVANVRRRVELAKERVRETEREAAIQFVRDRERTRLLKNQSRPESMEAEYDGNESEEEERMLEEMTRGYVMDDFEFGLQSKSALPRESDSSGFSGRTWNSSIGSNPTTAGTSLSTVVEKTAIPEMPPLQSKTPPPSHPPPAQALPQPPFTGLSASAQLSSVQSVNGPPAQSVRSRRLSGQNNPKQLKIETATRSTPGPLTQPPSMPPPKPPSNSVTQPPNTAGVSSQYRQLQSNVSIRPPLPSAPRQALSPHTDLILSDVVLPPTPIITQTLTHDTENGIPRSGSPGRAQSRSGLRKNFSSSSLKNLKNRNLSVSNLDDGSDVSPNTPMSNQFGGNPFGKDLAGRLPAMPTLPTPIATAFRDRMNGAQTGGLYLFQSDINSPEIAGSPGLVGSAPIPLEHCPMEFVLRPFWLMRALYQTISHPRGGYLSTKLFVPRDVWRVNGVKIRSLEDKISNCDFLTAALQKLAKVDTYDADAVLEEMQALETVLDQVQATLTKKLGTDVGVQGSGVLFKDAPTLNEPESGVTGSKNASAAGKSSFSWRRLRSKNSGVGLTNSYSSKPVATDGPKGGLTMSTLPMTSLGTTRFAKRDMSSVQFSGPNANYMGALARLFDAAQVIDEIARQVEDPGLRHADTTQVGLELCTRHAAEFFGFYVCRFVLADVSLLLDKFIKRGSEWVLV